MLLYIWNRYWHKLITYFHSFSIMQQLWFQDTSITFNILTSFAEFAVVTMIMQPVQRHRNSDCQILTCSELFFLTSIIYIPVNNFSANQLLIFWKGEYVLNHRATDLERRFNMGRFFFISPLSCKSQLYKLYFFRSTETDLITIQFPFFSFRLCIYQYSQ